MGQQLFYKHLTPEEIKMHQFGKTNPEISSIMLADKSFNSKPSYLIITDSKVSRDELKGLKSLEKELGEGMEILTEEEFCGINDIALYGLFYARPAA